MKPIIKIILSLFFAGNFFPAIAQFHRDSIKTTLLVLIDAEKFEAVNCSTAIDESEQWFKWFPSTRHEELWISEATIHQNKKRMSYDGYGLGSNNYFFYLDSTTNLVRLIYANPATHYEMTRFNIPLAKSRNNQWKVKKIYLVSPNIHDNNLSNEYAIIHYVYDLGPRGEVYKTLLISCHGKVNGLEPEDILVIRLSNMIFPSKPTSIPLFLWTSMQMDISILSM